MTRLKEIAVIYTGYSNKIKHGNKIDKWITFKSIKNDTYEEINHSLKEGTINLLMLNERSIVISSVSSSKLFAYGKENKGYIVGKGLYKIELINDDIPVEFIMSLFKNGALNLPYEGTIIKTLKKQDLENVKIKIPSKEQIDFLVKLEKYQNLLQKQLKNIKKYSKEYIRRIHGKNS